MYTSYLKIYMIMKKTFQEGVKWVFYTLKITQFPKVTHFAFYVEPHTRPLLGYCS